MMGDFGFKYNIGEVVRIREEENCLRCTDVGFTHTMSKLCGKKFPVKRRFLHRHHRCYKLEGEDGYWTWKEDWLKPVIVPYKLPEELFEI